MGLNNINFELNHIYLIWIKAIINEKEVHDETLFEVNYITYFRTNLLHRNRDLTSLSDMKRR